jgi:hypothetical protein
VAETKSADDLPETTKRDEAGFGWQMGGTRKEKAQGLATYILKDEGDWSELESYFNNTTLARIFDIKFKSFF